jgi:hypothetical protein
MRGKNTHQEHMKTKLIGFDSHRGPCESEENKCM